MRRLTLLLAIIVTVAPFSTMPLQAASRDFPNDQAPACNVTAPGKIRLITQVQPFVPIGPAVLLDTGEKNIPGGCTAGGGVGGVAPTLIEELCKACNKIGTASAACAGGPDFTCTVGGFSRIAVTNVLAPTPGVEVKGVPDPFPPVPWPTPTSRLTALNHTTDAGNTVQVDLLPDLQVQFTPSGGTGNINIKVHFTDNTESVIPTIITNASMKQSQIAAAVATGFTNLGYPSVTSGDLSSQIPGFFSGASVRVRNVTTSPVAGKTVQYVSIQGPVGVLVKVANEDPAAGPGLPAMSDWTIALLIGLLLLMGTWLLRRRSMTQAV